jgi:hypothetical protein
MLAEADGDSRLFAREVGNAEFLKICQSATRFTGAFIGNVTRPSSIP